MEVEEGEGVRRWRRFPVSPHTISSFRRVMKSSSFKPSSREFCSNYRQVDINSSAPNPNILQLYVLIAQKTSKSSIDDFKIQVLEILNCRLRKNTGDLHLVFLDPTGSVL